MTIVAAVGLVPVVAWTAASAGSEPPVDCTPPSTTGGETCVAPAPAPAVEPALAPTTQPAPADSTTMPPTATSTTVPTSTTAPSGPSATSTTAVADGSTTTTAPESSTTVDPAATTTTVDPSITTTTVDPATTTTTTVAPAPPVEDSDSAPMPPPVEVPSGRVVVGALDTGQVRPVAFPVAGPISYSNDWGACRDGCTRSHKGNDLIGDRRQPILAMHDGVIDHLVEHPTAGFGVVIRDDEGWEYHVYHMNNDAPASDDGADDGTWRFLPGIVAGARVTAGQQIGWMGDSGNSEGSVPHAHVEIHTPAGTAINPYWSLRAAQRAVNCAVGLVGQPEIVAPTPVDLAAGEALATPTPEAAAAQPVLATTTLTAAEPAAAGWFEAAWATAALPTGWEPFTVSGGRPGSADVGGRFWISPAGYTPVDAAAARVGDARYDAGVDCTQPTQAAAPIPAELAVILATIRHMETRGDYTVAVTTSSASGAYGFLDSSWGGYGGYARARDAPPPVQDAKAAELAMSILERNGGDVSTIPVSWYIGHVPVGDEWDTVPRPDAGNKITPREYQRRWLNKYAELLGNPGAFTSSAGQAMVTVDMSATCRTVVVDVGTAGQPQYVLTQAQSFLVDGAGRAVPDAIDPCDPARALTAAPAPVAPDATGTADPELAGKLEEPVIVTTGPR